MKTENKSTFNVGDIVTIAKEYRDSANLVGASRICINQFYGKRMPIKV